MVEFDVVWLTMKELKEIIQKFYNLKDDDNLVLMQNGNDRLQTIVRADKYGQIEMFKNR